MKKYIIYGDRAIFHPSYYLEELIACNGEFTEEFAEKLGLPLSHFQLLLDGEMGITVDMANRLSLELGTSVGYWLNLQRTYDEVKENHREEILENE